MAIYINFPPANTLKEFLLQLWIVPAPYYYNRKFIQTYSNEKCTKIQCEFGRMRSFDDILEIVRTYFPKTSAEQLFHELLIMEDWVSYPEGHVYTPNDKILEGKRICPSLTNCSTMRKIRFTRIYDVSNTGPNVNLDAFCNKYDSVYSWEDLFESIGFKRSDITTANVNAYIAKYSNFKHK